MKLLALSIASVFAAVTQAQTPSPPDDAKDQKEQPNSPRPSVEAGASSIDIIHALEQHLRKYPETKQRAAIEKGLVKSAMDLNDQARIVLYGEKVLAREPAGASDDMTLIDRVTRALVDKEDAAQAKKALAIREALRSRYCGNAQRGAAPGHLTPGQWSDELDRASARALALEARATRLCGRSGTRRENRREIWAAYPTGEGARETAFWLAKLGRDADAIEYYSDAFALEDTRTTESDRMRDRTAPRHPVLETERVRERSWRPDPAGLRPHFRASQRSPRKPEIQRPQRAGNQHRGFR